MYCPFCGSPNTKVTNSRLTHANAEVWRRRKCLACKELFTTHEIIDLSNLTVQKSSGRMQRFSHTKLYSSIYNATIGGAEVEHRAAIVSQLSREIEAQILALKQKIIPSKQIATMIMAGLKRVHPPSFLHYLAYYKHIRTTEQLLRELRTYTK